MTRSRDAVATRAAILAAARLRFAASGFQPTTIRAVAADAGVDPALVMHYFGSKQGLFDEAAQLDIQMPDLTGVEPGDVAARLMPIFSRLWGPDGPLLPLLRAAATSRPAADALMAVFTTRVAPAVTRVSVDGDPRRAALIGAHVLGVVMSRFVLETPPLRDMGEPELAAWLGPVLAHYLTVDLPAPPPRRRRSSR